MNVCSVLLSLHHNLLAVDNVELTLHGVLHALSLQVVNLEAASRSFFVNTRSITNSRGCVIIEDKCESGSRSSYIVCGLQVSAVSSERSPISLVEGIVGTRALQDVVVLIASLPGHSCCLGNANEVVVFERIGTCYCWHRVSIGSLSIEDYAFIGRHLSASYLRHPCRALLCVHLHRVCLDACTAEVECTIIATGSVDGSRESDIHIAFHRSRIAKIDRTTSCIGKGNVVNPCILACCV